MSVSAPRLPSDPLRRAAVQELVSRLPASVGDEWLETEVCQGRIHYTGYNPGTDLCHWLLWKLGCRDSRLLCRDVSEKGIVWSRHGIESLYLGSQKLAAWRPFQLDRMPDPGDIIHLGAPNKGDPYGVCVFLWSTGNEWVVADGSHADAFGDPCAFIVVSRFAGYHLSCAGQKKQINGWVDITQLGLRATG